MSTVVRIPLTWPQRDRFLKAGTRCHKRCGQVKHLLERRVAKHQPQIGVIDCHCLRDQGSAPQAVMSFSELSHLQFRRASPRQTATIGQPGAKRNL